MPCGNLHYLDGYRAARAGGHRRLLDRPHRRHGDDTTRRRGVLQPVAGTRRSVDRLPTSAALRSATRSGGLGAPLRGAHPRLGACRLGDGALGVGDLGARVGERGLELGDPTVGVVDSLLRVAYRSVSASRISSATASARSRGFGERGRGPTRRELVTRGCRRRPLGASRAGRAWARERHRPRRVTDVAEEPDGGRELRGQAPPEQVVLQRRIERGRCRGWRRCSHGRRRVDRRTTPPPR